MRQMPATRYTQSSDGTYIAYQVLGDGDVDVLYISPWLSHLEVIWEYPPAASFLRGIASFARAIFMDPRGGGLSDRKGAQVDLETRADDVRAVLDAAGSERTVLWGAGVDGGALCSYLAATSPDRVLALILWNSAARTAWAPDYPEGIGSEEIETFQRLIREGRGIDERMADLARAAGAGSVADDPEAVRWFARFARHAASPGDALEMDTAFNEIDFRRILPAIQVPTAVMHRSDAEVTADAEYLAARIPGARLMASATGTDHPPYLGDTATVLEEVEGFVRSVRREQEEFDRVLATVLFTDIVGSTERLAERDARGWKELVERHHATIRGLLTRYRGREIDTAGDGFFAAFDGPVRAIRCGAAIASSVRALGLEVRVGVHTGECEVIDGKPGGLPVVIGARIGAIAEPSEVLVSQTVKDLVAGSGLAFEDRGEHELKGVPDRWRTYRLVGDA